jgi:hypothetical protein
MVPSRTSPVIGAKLHRELATTELHRQSGRLLGGDPVADGQRLQLLVKLTMVTSGAAATLRHHAEAQQSNAKERKTGRLGRRCVHTRNKLKRRISIVVRHELCE